MDRRHGGKFRTGFLGWCLVISALGLSEPGVVGGAPLTPGARSFDAWDRQGPAALALAVRPATDLPALATAAVDVQAALAEDAERDMTGLPPRFALAEAVAISPRTHGSWETVDPRWRLWRLRIQAPGALSLNLGFSGYRLPKGGRLAIYPAGIQDLADPRLHWEFTEQDNAPHGELWTPVVLTDDLVVELLLPLASADDYVLELASVNKGYRYFGEDLVPMDAPDKAGLCNIDVICPEGDPWRAEINSVGVYTIGGAWTCTGAMINNTAEDQRPYFLTANHCQINTGNAASMVVYWNFQSPVCGQQGGGSLTDFTSGATFKASSSTSDFCLVELSGAPDPDFAVTFAGWNRSSADPASVTAIHHPNTDEKSISFEHDPTSTTTYLKTAVPGDGTHIRVTDWDLGTTEPGSSGSPLFNPGHQIVGQLHGGYAACDNNDSDWYGRFSVSWSQLSQYLDPLNLGVLSLDTFDPQVVPFQVSPPGGLAAAGPVGGPFVPTNLVYTLENGSAVPVSYLVTTDVAWVNISGPTGTLPAGGSALVTVSLAPSADSLGSGAYAGVVTFTNLTDGIGTTQRPVTLQVGVPELVYAVGMDTDPGWTLGTGWAYGPPLGGGGEYGDPDPVSGHTGPNVVGYNLAGDYENNLPERIAVSAPFDCTALTGVTVKFWRWLGVEQSQYDHAAFKVSTDGVNLTTVWSNSAETADGVWTQVSYDISALADGQPAVTLAWVMGTTDDSWRFCGWNLDDVEIWGLTSGLSAGGDLPAAGLTLDNHPNPFNPLTKIQFSLDRPGAVMLRIYDVQGRIVRRLLTADLAAGPHAVVWDGTDDQGRHAGSGVYFAKLTAGGRTVQHKMVMLR